MNRTHRKQLFVHALNGIFQCSIMPVPAHSCQFGFITALSLPETASSTLKTHKAGCSRPAYPAPSAYIPSRWALELWGPHMQTCVCRASVYSTCFFMPYESWIIFGTIHTGWSSSAIRSASVLLHYAIECHVWHGHVCVCYAWHQYGYMCEHISIYSPVFYQHVSHILFYANIFVWTFVY